jgi:hypothetical protein
MIASRSPIPSLGAELNSVIETSPAFDGHPCAWVMPLVVVETEPAFLPGIEASVHSHVTGPAGREGGTL